MTQRILVRFVAIISLGLSILATPSAVASNWPRFHGPNGTGTTGQDSVPALWTSKEILWKAPIPGVGNSSPIVWGTRIFVQSSSANGSQRQLLCLNAPDGKILWSHSIAGARAHIHPKNSWASSTPATNGELVVCLFWDGKNLALHAFDMEGHPLWHQDLGKFTGQHGPGASPVLYGNMVFLANDQDGASELLAFDASSGQPRWHAPRKPFRACYSSPFIWEKPGETPELIVASTAGITSYNPGIGQINWNWDWTFDGAPLRTVGSPILAQGLIVANSGDGGGARHTVALKPPNKDTVSPELVWENKKIFPYAPSLLCHGNHLFFVNDKGLAGCSSIKTGELAWTERLGGNVTASPVLIDDKIFAPSEEGIVYVFLAADHFKLVAKNTIGESIFASPAVANNRLYIRGKDHLFCIGNPK